MRLLLFLLVLFVHTAFAQEGFHTKKTTTDKARKYLKSSVAESNRGNTKKALIYVKKALKADPVFVDAIIHFGAIEYDSDHLAEAKKLFEQAYQLAPDYRKSVLYKIGVTEWKRDEFESAAGYFERYIQSNPKSKRRLKKASQYLKNCRFAAGAIKHPVPYHPESLGSAVNTGNPEYLPVLTADKKTLVFTRLTGKGRYANEDFYISKLKNGEWQKAMPIVELNTDENEGGQTLSADGKMMVFTACNRKGGAGRCDLYFSEYKNGHWTPVKNMGHTVNSPAWESLPSISPNKDAVYFASNRKGGYGGSDIWVTYRQPDGKWGKPVNLGENINTELDDQAPFIHPDNKTLYFMSRGHAGMGGYDIFFTKRKPDGSWDKPKNIGYPINTKGEEGALFVTLDGETAYFATDVKNINPGKEKITEKNSDIFSFPLYEGARPDPVTYVKAIVLDAVSKSPVTAALEFLDFEKGISFLKGQTDADGEFLSCLPIGQDYALTISKEGYLFHSEHFSLTKAETKDNAFELTIYLQPIVKDVSNAKESEPVILKNVFFATGSAELRPESLVELNKLKALMDASPKLKIRINGHTDNVGKEEDNLVLSNNRAKAVYDFLIKNGISAGRLAYKGFGESKPIDTNDTEQGRQHNRRTEFEVIGWME